MCAHDLHMIVPGPLERTCWRRFAVVRRLSKILNCAIECNYYYHYCTFCHVHPHVLFYWRESHEATCTFCHVHPHAKALAVAPLSKLCRRPLTGQRKLPEPSSSLGRHLRYPLSRQPVCLCCFGTVDSLFVLGLEPSLTQDAMWAFCCDPFQKLSNTAEQTEW